MSKWRCAFCANLRDSWSDLDKPRVYSAYSSASLTTSDPSADMWRSQKNTRRSGWFNLRYELARPRLPSAAHPETDAAGLTARCQACASQLRRLRSPGRDRQSQPCRQQHAIASRDPWRTWRTASFLARPRTHRRRRRSRAPLPG